MTFEHIDEVTEAINPRDANDKLSDGWRLLAVVRGTDQQPHSHVKYVLGRAKPAELPQQHGMLTKPR